MKRVSSLTALSLILAMVPCVASVQVRGKGGGAISLVRSAQAEENWKQQFAEVCGKTDDSMSMTTDELKTLLEKCDKLKPLIEGQDETTRKVYLRRLQMCRDLLAYVYEVKSKK